MLKHLTVLISRKFFSAALVVLFSPLLYAYDVILNIHDNGPSKPYYPWDLALGTRTNLNTMSSSFASMIKKSSNIENIPMTQYKQAIPADGSFALGRSVFKNVQAVTQFKNENIKFLVENQGFLRPTKKQIDLDSIVQGNVLEISSNGDSLLTGIPLEKDHEILKPKIYNTHGRLELILDEELKQAFIKHYANISNFDWIKTIPVQSMTFEEIEGSYLILYNYGWFFAVINTESENLDIFILRNNQICKNQPAKSGKFKDILHQLSQLKPIDLENYQLRIQQTASVFDWIDQVKISADGRFFGIIANKSNAPVHTQYVQLWDREENTQKTILMHASQINIEISSTGTIAGTYSDQNTFTKKLFYYSTLTKLKTVQELVSPEILKYYNPVSINRISKDGLTFAGLLKKQSLNNNETLTTYSITIRPKKNRVVASKKIEEKEEIVPEIENNHPPQYPGYCKNLSRLRLTDLVNLILSPTSSACTKHHG